MPTFLIRVTGEIEIEAENYEEAEVIYEQMDLREMDLVYEIEEAD